LTASASHGVWTLRTQYSSASRHCGTQYIGAKFSGYFDTVPKYPTNAGTDAQVLPVRKGTNSRLSNIVPRGAGAGARCRSSSVKL